VSAEHDRERFGRNITLLRHRRGLSKAALARKADVSRDSLRQIEAGLRTAHFDTLMALADALGIDPGDLFSGLRPSCGQRDQSSRLQAQSR
jgi:transcriptional regulator with XRE-family HTH domain